jgi:DNA mismatch repair protein MutS2
MYIPDKEKLIRKAHKSLGWDEIKSRLSSLTISSMGAELALSLIPENVSFESIKINLAETSEMKILLSDKEQFPLSRFEDMRVAIGRALKGITLETNELREISNIMNISVTVKSFLSRLKDNAPVLWRKIDDIKDIPKLKEKIDFCITESGEINEGATHEIKELYHSARFMRNRIIKRLNYYLSSSEFSTILTDNYYTQREERYVIPVKAEYKSKIDGIVHDSSSSGVTIFLEPSDTIELNNQLKIIKLQLEKEIQRLLKELTMLVAGASSEIERNLAILAELDLIGAKGRLSQIMNAIEAKINSEGNINLIATRHPLLVLSDKSVVPNDIAISPDINVLIVSGPNAGGKTVTLKTVGLIGLMVKAGLHIPVGDCSEMAVFPDIYADIGDEQDIESHLSTFSGHLLNITGILNFSSPSSLILLDELMISTDPSEGGALAEAILAELSERGAKVITTTHYGQLKAAGTLRKGFKNISVEFDSKTMLPTYKLIQDTAGSSSALHIAQQLGMDERIIEIASLLIKERDRRFDEAVSKLEIIKNSLDEELQRVSLLNIKSEELLKEQVQITERMREEEKEYLKLKKKKLSKDISDARNKIKWIINELEAERTSVKIRETNEKIEKIAEEILISAPDTEYIPLSQLSSGDVVEIPRLGVNGFLLEDPSDKKKVRVRLGSVETVVKADMLKGKEKMESKNFNIETAYTPASPPHNSETQCNLRGMRVYDAREATVRFLDRAYQSDIAEVKIIHGHGTDAIKKMVREYLVESPYVNSFRPGDMHEGGDGVTIVELKN